LLVGFAEFDLDLVGAFDHVVVGEDVAFRVEHDARTGGGAATLRFRFAEGVEAFRRFFGRDRRFDEGDAVAVGLVDLIDGVAVAAFAFGGRRGDRRGGRLL